MAWSIFIFYEVVLVGVAYGAFGHPVTYFLHYLVVILYFYSLSEIGLPWATRSNKLVQFRIFLLFTMSFVVYILARHFVDLLLQHNGMLESFPLVKINRASILKDFYRFVYFSAFALVYFYTRNFIIERKRVRDLEEQRLMSLIEQDKTAKALMRAENDFLRAQINPHFLFNTLNFIHNNISSNPQDASEGILLLSDIMRYAIDNPNVDGMVKIADEVDQLFKLLKLYRLKAGKDPNIDLIVEKSAQEIWIPPLILLTLMENVFKHGNLARPNERARMEIYQECNQLMVNTHNLINRKPNKTGTNTGMRNLRERIENTYGFKASMEFGELTREYFSVLICIPVVE